MKEEVLNEPRTSLKTDTEESRQFVDHDRNADGTTGDVSDDNAEIRTPFDSSSGDRGAREEGRGRGKRREVVVGEGGGRRRVKGNTTISMVKSGCDFQAFRRNTVAC
eukprot:768399-Hanusia_phi.AAC.3